MLDPQRLIFMVIASLVLIRFGGSGISLVNGGSTTRLSSTTEKPLGPAISIAFIRAFHSGHFSGILGTHI